MGSVKVDEIGVSVGQKERPNGLSVGSRSASDKKVVPRFIQDKVRIGSLIYGSSSSRVAGRIVVSSWTRNRWLANGISSSVHNTHTHFWHSNSNLEKMYLVIYLCPKKSFIVWLKMGMFARKFSTINRFVSLLWKSWKRGREPVHRLYSQ